MRENMMNGKITIYGLSGCKLCNEIKDKIKNDVNLDIRFIWVDDNDRLADKIENLYKTDVYPIIELQKYSDSNKYVFLRKTYLENEEKFITFITYDELIYKIKNI